MKTLLLALGLCCAVLAVEPTRAAGAAATTAAARARPGIDTVAWRPWSQTVFNEARARKKYVLLDLGAAWCHWCHVMDATTYRDPEVLRLIREHYIPVRVDQDTRPDLSRRYEAYGWPATIVMDADGNDIGKMRGYRDPVRFAATLQAILQDPSPLGHPADDDRDKTYRGDSQLAQTTRVELQSRFREALDHDIGGIRQMQRYLSRDTLEYGMALAAGGEAQAERWVRLTLDQARALIDPVWGGMYQYSTHSDWVHPHYEKIIDIQATALLLYARAWRTWGDPAHLAAAQAIRRYVKVFLTGPTGGIYTSQDADHVPGEQGDAYFALDDAPRRALGVPRVDTHVYTRENGWMIEALVEFYGATGDAAAIADAERAARHIVARRGNRDGSFRRDARDQAGPFFGDQLAMGRAMLALYSATGQREWLQRARAVRHQFARYAAPNGGGYLSSPYRAANPLKPRPHIDENLDAARFANLLHRYTGDAADRAAAQIALRYVSDADVALRAAVLPGVLLANDEAGADPLHITVIGAKADAGARALHAAALRQGADYRRIEWWDPAEGRLLNPDVTYTVLKQPAAFVCTERTCSLPLLQPADIARHIARLTSRRRRPCGCAPPAWARRRPVLRRRSRRWWHLPRVLPGSPLPPAHPP